MRWQKYVLTFVITAAIFATAFYVASRFDAQRVADIRATQEAISVDILSLETQFELLGNLDCQLIGDNPVLSQELNDLAGRLSVAEENLGTNNEEVTLLKKQYSLLEIKDYLLMGEIARKCADFNPVSVLYFYSNEGDCTECSRQGQVLTYLREQYPDLRVYSFDYHLELSALQTLVRLLKIRGELPVLVVGNRAPAYGFKNLEEMEVLIPELATLATTTRGQ